MFPKIDALPSSKVQDATLDRYGQSRRRKNAPHMRSHIIRTFGNMVIDPIPIRYEPCEKRIQIPANIPIRILLNDERGGCMVDENMTEANVHLSRFDHLSNLPSNVDQTATRGPDPNIRTVHRSTPIPRHPHPRYCIHRMGSLSTDYRIHRRNEGTYEATA